MKKITRSALYLLLSVSVFLGCVLSAPVPASASGPEQMEVHFMDVGQGDATLVTCGGHTMLIDAGDDTKGTAIQNYLQKQKISKLDYLVLTHPDADQTNQGVDSKSQFQIHTGNRQHYHPGS